MKLYIIATMKQINTKNQYHSYLKVFGFKDIHMEVIIYI